MQDIVSVQDKLVWFLAVTLGFPLLMIALGELIEGLERRKKAISAPLKSFRNLVLPLLVLFVILTRLANLDFSGIAVRIVQTALWVTVIYTALSLLNVILFASAKAGGWQDKIPKLLVDLSRVFLVLIGAAIVLSTVWGTDLGGVLAALGVGSLVLGLALQDSLGNVFSGVAMLFEQPLSQDEWIKVGDTTGRVVEITWRSVHLETAAGDLVIVPNAQIAQSSFTNLSRPQPSYEKVVNISFSYDDPPQKVIQILRQTALEAPGVIPDSIWLKIDSYGDFAINYTVGLSAPTMSQSVRMRNAFMMRLWYVAKRHNLTMPYPIATQVEYQGSTPNPEEQANHVKSVLMEIPSLTRLDSKALDTIVESGCILEYCSGETIVHLDDKLAGLYFIVRGEVQLSSFSSVAKPLANGAKSELTLGQLSKGEFFGEQACLMVEQRSNFAVTALTDVQLFMVERKHLEQILEQSPRLSQQIAEVMEIRQRATSQLLPSQAA